MSIRSKALRAASAAAIIVMAATTLISAPPARAQAVDDWRNWKDQSNPHPSHMSNAAEWPADAAITWANVHVGQTYWSDRYATACKVVRAGTFPELPSVRLRCWTAPPVTNVAALNAALSAGLPHIANQTFNALDKLSR